MALIQFNVDLSRCAAALERIAHVLEREFPEPILIDEPVDPPRTRVYNVDPHAIWEREAQEMRDRGEDPEFLAYSPPRVGRREGK